MEYADKLLLWLSAACIVGGVGLGILIAMFIYTCVGSRKRKLRGTAQSLATMSNDVHLQSLHGSQSSRRYDEDVADMATNLAYVSAANATAVDTDNVACDSSSDD